MSSSAINPHTSLYLWLAAIFITCLLVANLTGSLLFTVDLPWGGQALLSAGIIPFPVTFLLTDLLNEFYGQQGARQVTLIGFGMSLLTFVLLSVAQQLQVAPFSQLTQLQYLHFSKLYTGMFVASLAAYLVGQFLDIYLFQWFRSQTHNRFLWLRATGSTVISQLFDSVLVTFIAFWGVHSLETITQIALNNYVWKFGIAIGITPVLYLGHQFLKGILLPRAEGAGKKSSFSSFSNTEPVPGNISAN